MGDGANAEPPVSGVAKIDKELQGTYRVLKKFLQTAT